LLSGIFLFGATTKLLWNAKDNSHELLVNLFDRDTVFAMGAVELFIAASLVLFAKEYWPWVFAVGALAVFLMVNLMFVIVGQTRCECFGPIQTNPLLTLLIDIGALSAAWICRPKASLAIANGLHMTELRTAISLVVLALTFFFIADFLVPGRLAVARAYGVPLISSERVLFAGTNTAGDEPVVEVNLLNCSSKTARIVGYAAVCGQRCDLRRPIDVSPSGSAMLHFRPRIGRPRGVGSGTLTLFVSQDGIQTLRIPFVYLSTGVRVHE
jgi:hypothetical protein